jgi:TctA family transporter
MIGRVNSSILVVVIMPLSLMGIYCLNTCCFAAMMPLVMGVLGYIPLRIKLSIVNLVMGFILGEMVEMIRKIET